MNGFVVDEEEQEEQADRTKYCHHSPLKLFLSVLYVALGSSSGGCKRGLASCSNRRKHKSQTEHRTWITWVLDGQFKDHSSIRKRIWSGSS